MDGCRRLAETACCISQGNLTEAPFCVHQYLSVLMQVQVLQSFFLAEWNYCSAKHVLPLQPVVPISTKLIANTAVTTQHPFHAYASQGGLPD